MIVSYQALITLDLKSNQIGETGAFYMSDGLRSNKVKKIFYYFFDFIL